MPVILPRADHARWLDPEAQDPDELLPLLRPYPEGEMVAYPVSLLVNNPRTDGPQCIEPLAG